MQLYNRLSPEYDSLFLNNILEFKRNLNGDESYVDFYPSLGFKKGERCEFLFIGQAVNGWASGFGSKSIVTKDHIEEAILASNRAIGKHSPIDWVNIRWSKSAYNGYEKECQQFYPHGEGKPYYCFRSFFWNVVYSTLNDFYKLNGSDEWTRKLAWSNLYKIAPDHCNPNPDDREKQFVLSVELLKQEIKEIKPKFCIVITSWSWWKPFSEAMNLLRSIPADSPEIEGVSMFGETKIIVTKRPFIGPSKRFAQQIIREIEG